MFTASLPASAQRGNPQVQFEGQTIDEMIAAFMSEHRIPGMTLAIVQAPYIPRVVGYGISDVEKRLLASPKTLWHVGQLTQAYTAVAIMQLVEAGKVKLDDPAGGHDPQAPSSPAPGPSSPPTCIRRFRDPACPPTSPLPPPRRHRPTVPR